MSEVCNEDIILSALMSSRFVPQILLCSEWLKVGRHHGDMVGSASHSEQHKAILYLWPALEPLQLDKGMEERDT